jgi:hypothetical protein
MTKTREALNGEIAQVGDIVVCIQFGAETWRHPITRVTPKRAYMACNERYEFAFQRQYNGWRWRRIGGQDPHAIFRLHKASA